MGKLLVTVKSKDTTFAVISMAADTQLGKRDTDSLYPHFSSLPQKSSSRNQKPLKRTLKKWDEDAEV